MTTRRRRICVLAPGPLFPARDGGSVRCLRIAEALSARGHEVAILTNDPRRVTLLCEGEAESFVAPPSLERLRYVRRAGAGLLLRLGVPLEELNFFLPAVDPGVVARLRWLLERFDAEVLHFSYPGFAIPCNLVRPRRMVVADMHNVESERIARVAGLRAPVARRLRRLECFLLRRSDRIVAVSERDRKTFVAMGIRADRTAVVPNGVDLEAYRNVSPRDLRTTEPLIAYHGIFSYPPNAEAARDLVGEVIPRVCRAGRRAVALLIGADLPADLAESGAIAPGFVEHVAPWLAAATIAAVPLRRGGGTRMKILEYFAAGVPVVSTTMGADGLDVRDGEHLLIRDDVEGFANAIGLLLDDGALRRRLADHGRALVSRCDWSEAAVAFEAIYDSARGAPARERA